MKIKYSIFLVIISGLLTGLTFPAMFGGVAFPNLGFMAWFSLVPLFVAIHNVGARRAFGLAFITGFAAYSISFYWVYNALTNFGGLPPAMAICIMFLMMVVISTFFALPAAWSMWFKSRWGGPAILLLPVAWVAAEIARNFFPFGGFPWNSIAYSQWAYPLLIQTADIFSIYGLIFLIIMVNLLIAELIVLTSHSCAVGDCKPCLKSLSARTIPVVFFIVLTLAYGWYRLETTEFRSPAAESIKVALIQGNIPQDEKWNPKLSKINLGVYQEYMKMIRESDIDLVVWPESAYPYLVPTSYNAIEAERLSLNPEKEKTSWLLFGALSVEDNREDFVLYNSALLVDNAGWIRGRYHKIHLVPFGEYVPMRQILFFVDKLVGAEGDFSRGNDFTPLSVGALYKIGPLICYEDVFPEISRSMVLNGANVLINLTNDAWYGWSSAAGQHLAISVFRAVENRRFMLRSTNTGISAVIDPAGRIEIKSDLFERSFIVTGVPVLKGLTTYDIIGDLFAYLCAVIVLVLTVIVLSRGIYTVITARKQQMHHSGSDPE